ncbi:MAG: hypothetical protein OXE52_13770 [Chloroflexi bacterium]|nr:hypothetical protein [Chloroflexota bacterium]
MTFTEAHREFKVQISPTEIAAPTYPVVIKDRTTRNGLAAISHSIRQLYEAQEGFVAGLARQHNTYMLEAPPITFVVDGNDEMKVFIGKHGQFLYIEDKQLGLDGTTVKWKYDIAGGIVSVVPGQTGRGMKRLTVEMVVTEYAVTVP